MAEIHDQDISISIFLSDSSFFFFSDLSSFSSTLVQITNYTNRCFKLDQTQQNIIFKKCVLNKVDKLEKNTGKIRIRHRQSSLSYTPNVFFLNKFST